MKQVLKIGIPVALQDGFIQIAFIVITVIANRRGLNDAAAVGIVEKADRNCVPGAVHHAFSSVCSFCTEYRGRKTGARSKNSEVTR